MKHSDPVFLNRLQLLYDRSEFLTAWRELEPLGIPETLSDPELRLFAGRLIRFLGDPERGERLLLRTWRHWPDLPSTRLHCAWIVSGRRGPWAAIRRLHEWFSDRLPDGAEAADWWWLKGDLLSRLRDFDRAGTCLEEGSRRQPTDPWGQVCRALHCERMDRLDEAEEAIGVALQLNPRYPHALQVKAHLLQVQGRMAEALEALESACSTTENGLCAQQLAGLYKELGRPDDLDRILARHEALSPLASPVMLQGRARFRAEAACQRGDMAGTARWFAQAGDSEFCRGIVQRLSDPGIVRRRHELAVAFVRQQHLTCVPATLTALGQFWNRPVDHLEVAEAICYDGTPGHSERRWAVERGWIVREFRLTWDSARELLNRGLPFALTTVFPGGAHEQAVFGYDELRDTLLIRDPSSPLRTEFMMEPGLRALASTGPRAMVLVPPEHADLLSGIVLPDSPLYDAVYELAQALDRHERPAAVEALERLEQLDPRHRLTLHARRQLGHYDGNLPAQLSAVEALLEQDPEDANLQVIRLRLFRELRPRADRVEWLAAACRRRGSDPLLWHELAWDLTADAREHAEAVRWLDRAGRQRPLDGFAFLIRAQIAADRGDTGQAVELYRIAACLEDKRPGSAEAYFRAARWELRTREAIEWLTQRFHRDGTRSSLPARTLAWAYSTLGEGTSALAILEQGVERRPQDAALRLHVAAEYARWGDLSAATAHLEAVKTPASPTEWARTAAVIAGRRGDAREQLAQWRRVLELEPLAFDAHRAVSVLLAETEGRPAALQHLASAVSRFPYQFTLRQLRVEWLRDDDPECWEQEVRDYLALEPRNAWTLRELGAVLTCRRAYAEAHVHLDAAHELEPRSPSLFNVRGDLFLAEGNPDAARRDFMRALQLAVDNTWAMQRLLKACDDGPERREAIRFIETELVRQTTTGAGWLEFMDLARPYLTSWELHDLLERAHRARPDLWQTWSTLARQKSALAHHHEALSLIDEANRRFPLLARLWLDRSSILLARHDHVGERQALEKACQLDPEWGEASRALARACYSTGDPDEALRVLEEAARRSPLDSLTQVALGEARRKRGDLAGAIEAFRAAVLSAPGNEWAWQELDSLGRSQGQPELAGELAEELLQRRPGEARSWWLRARSLHGPGSRDRQLELLDRALSLNPTMIPALRLRADLLADSSRWEEALATFRPTVLRGSRPPALLLAEAELRARRGNLEAAVALAQDAVTADPGFVDGWRNLIQWHADTGNPARAIEAAEHLTRIAPLDPAPHGFLGEMHLHAQEPGKALDAFQRAFELDPQYVFGGVRLLELQLDQGELEGAAATLQRLKPHLADAHAAEFELALVLGRSGPAPEALGGAIRTLVLSRSDEPAVFQRTTGRLARAQQAPTARSIVEGLLEEPVVNPNAGSLWVQLRGPIPLRRLLPTLERLGFSSPVAVRAWERWLEEVGDQLGSPQHRQDVFRAFRDEGFRRVLRRHGPALAASTPLWGKVGYVLIATGRWKRLARWMADWESKPDAAPWMLNNYAWALARTGRERPFRELLPRLATLEPKDTMSIRFELWDALFRLADDVDEPARALADQLNVEALSPYDQVLLKALKVWLRFPAGGAPQPLTAADRAVLKQFALGHEDVPVLTVLFQRQMARLRSRVQWPWTAVWSSVLPGGFVYRFGLGIASGVAVGLVSVGNEVGALLLPVLLGAWIYFLRRRSS